jgi:hypothetical protein
MPIKSSGQLLFTEIVAEFADTAPHYLSEFYRGGGKVPTNNTNVPASGAIYFSNFYSAVNRNTVNYIFSSNTQQATINPTSLPGYVAGISDITITVNPGIYVWSDSTSVPGLTIGSANSGDTITLVNNGYIIGRGADGINGWLFQAGNPGGPALTINFPVTINNTNASAYIAGGGGGGGSVNYVSQAGGGGGAGGGKGGDVDSNGNFGAGGAGGLPGQIGGNGRTVFSGHNNSGGGGGRILPGVGGVSPAYGSYQTSFGRGGGAGASGTMAVFGASQGTPYMSIGGAGGGWGASAAAQGSRFGNATFGSTSGNGGSANNNGNLPTGMGGQPIHFGAPFGGAPGGRPGGAGGKAINLNGNSVTWVSGDTSRIWGAVS